MITIRRSFFKKYFKWFAAFGTLGIVIYPIIIKPFIDPSEYKSIQAKTRKHINQEKIQPGNMKVWSDPFNRKKAKQEEQ